MKDYYNLFVELTKQLCRKEDYADRRNIKRHNAATDKLFKLRDEMKRANQLDLLLELMTHDYDRTRTYAATFCLHLDFHTQEAIAVLEEASHTASDSTVRFSAKMVLREYYIKQGKCNAEDSLF